MTRCQQCQPLILDFLYGLLDESEAHALGSHLADCAVCSAVRDEARRVQSLLARAAKGTFPHVRFEPPPLVSPRELPATANPERSSPETIASEATPALSSSTRSITAKPWFAWALAASVLLAVPGTVIPILNLLHRAETARQVAQEAATVASAASVESEKALAALQRRQTEVAYNLTIAKQVQESLLAKWVEEEKIAAQNQSAHKMSVEVLKPATAQPGAPNEFLLVLHDRGLAPNTRLLAEVRDQSDAVVFAQRLDSERKDNRHTLLLPAETWTKLTPQSELFLVVSSIDERTGGKTELQEKVRLFGPVYATMLLTDRPTYRPGELLYFRSLTLDRVTFRPPGREQVLQYELRGPHQHPVARSVTGSTELVRIRDAKVEPVLGPDGKPLRGVGCGAIALPSDLPDGDYTLVAREIPHPAGAPSAMPFPATRTIKIRSGAVAVYAKQIGFAKASYSPGEQVEAWAELKLQDQPVSGTEVAVLASADNLSLAVEPAAVTGPDGRTHIRFRLPESLAQADVRLKVTFKTRTGEETIAQRVPVVGHRLIVEFFPEGGTLVAGIPNRVYIRATTPAGQPVDIRGTIVDGRTVLGRVETVTDPSQPGANRGLGSFYYTPTLGTPVWLKLESPRNLSAPLLEGPLPIAATVVAGAPAVLAARAGFMLPRPIADGVAMSVANPVSIPGEKILVQLQSAGRPRKLIVGAYTRGRLSDTQGITLQPGQPGLVKLMADNDLRGGVVRITVFEEPLENPEAGTDPKPDIKPIAERLVFRKPGESLALSYTATAARMENGNAANAAKPTDHSIDLVISAQDEKGQATAAIAWAAVINSGVEIDKQNRLLTTHFLLAGEVSTPDELEYADFLLTNHPKAAESLDMVLGTQGWRRFIEQTLTAFALHRQTVNADPLTPNPDQTKLLISNGQYPTQVEPMGVRERRKLYETYWPRYEEAIRKLAEAQAAYDEANLEKINDHQLHELVAAAEQKQDEARAAKERACVAAEPAERVRGAGWYGVAGFGLLGVMLGALALLRPLTRLPYGVGTAGSLGLVAFLIIALGLTDRTQAHAAYSSPQNIDNATRESPPVAPPAATSGNTPEDQASRTLRKTVVPDQAAVNQTALADTAGGTGAVAAKPSASMKASVAPVQPLSSANKLESAPAQPNESPLRAGVTQKPGNDVLPSGMGTTQLGRGPGVAPSTPDTPSVNGKSPPPAASPPTLAKDGSRSLPPRERDEKKAIADFELSQSVQAFGISGLREVAPSHEKSAAAEQGLKRTSEKVKEYQAERVKVANLGLEELKRRSQADKSSKAAPEADGKAKIPETAQTPEMMAFRRVKAAVPTIAPLVVREYAAPRPGAIGVDDEHSDTLLWMPVIVIPREGQAKLTFQLGSAPGGYQVLVAGHTLDGRIGAVRGLITVPPQTAQPGITVTPAVIPTTIP